ncbi:MAG: peroxide stress protein YaaA [Flavobacterium sp.]
MKIVISPAKSLDFESPLPTKLYTEYSFVKQSVSIDKVLKKKKPKQLMELMDISDKLADLNWQRNQERSVSEITNNNARPAIFAFSGDVYIGLEAYSLSDEQLNILQDKIRILSGLYGLLKPLDLIQPYRLEMGTKLSVGRNKNLYEFWRTTLTKELNSQLTQDELFINLASTEYFDAIDIKKIKVPVITPEFKDYKDGKLKMISFFAKKARGMMVRYIIDTNVETIEDLKGFNYDGYAFDANLSKGSTLVFKR